MHGGSSHISGSDVTYPCFCLLFLTAASLQDLTRPEVRTVAVAKPGLAPYRKATAEALRASGIWQTVEPKVVYGQNVSQTKQYGGSGNAEVAFLPLALVKPNEGRHIEVEERLHQPIDKALGVVNASGKQDVARRFAGFVLGAKGQVILEKSGYNKPPKNS